MTGAEFKKRRDRLMSMMAPGSIAIIPAAPERRRNRDIYYPFRQDSDFYYLTGFTEPQALLVLAPEREQGQEVIFVAERDARKELYDGEQMGPDRAVQLLGMDDAFPYGDMDDILPGMLEGKERIYVTLGDYPDVDQRLLQWVAQIRQRESGGAVPPGEFVELKHLLHELRLVKSKKELKLMQKAADISAAGHLRAMAACRPGTTEAQLEAELIYAFMSQGARAPAYPCIVGGGRNACVLHYVDNADTLVDGDLVLIDAGCEYEHYAADITRTFPVNGKFSGPQKALYEIVLAANKAAIEACVVGGTFNDPHARALEVMVDGLIALGILEGARANVIASEEHRRFVPHNTSHWLGIDVHDVGDYRLDQDWRDLTAGMVMTVEPGIYIPVEADDVPKAFRGTGVRIEDDIHITAAGPDNLTAAAVKEIAEIEAVMAGAGA